MPDTGTITDPQEARSTLAEKTEDVRFAMFSTVGARGELHSRPMATHEADEDGTLWFFTYADSQKVRDITANPQVGLGYADPGKNLWVSVSGSAELVRDQAKVEQLWSAPLKVFFPDGPQTPGIVLLRVTPADAEIWDGPSSVAGRAVAFARTLASNSSTPPGDDVTLDLSGR